MYHVSCITADIPPTEHTFHVTVTKYCEMQFLLHVCVSHKHLYPFLQRLSLYFTLCTYILHFPHPHMALPIHSPPTPCAPCHRPPRLEKEEKAEERSRPELKMRTQFIGLICCWLTEDTLVRADLRFFDENYCYGS